ncbi:MAG: hypothetical protein NUV77_18630 [Thermoguttaceae bacterium]|nr:hypothetical protein [Thermoguttaceae bacterium]
MPNQCLDAPRGQRLFDALVRFAQAGFQPIRGFGAGNRLDNRLHQGDRIAGLAERRARQVPLARLDEPLDQPHHRLAEVLEMLPVIGVVAVALEDLRQHVQGAIRVAIVAKHVGAGFAEVPEERDLIEPRVAGALVLEAVEPAQGAVPLVLAHEGHDLHPRIRRRGRPGEPGDSGRQGQRQRDQGRAESPCPTRATLLGRPPRLGRRRLVGSQGAWRDFRHGDDRRRWDDDHVGTRRAFQPSGRLNRRDGLEDDRRRGVARHRQGVEHLG